MRWNIIVECVGEDGKQSTITLGTVERLAESTTAENLGVNLQESKQIANRAANLRIAAALAIWLNSNKGTKCEIGILSKAVPALEFCSFCSSQNCVLFVRQFWGFDSEHILQFFV